MLSPRRAPWALHAGPSSLQGWPIRASQRTGCGALASVDLVDSIFLHTIPSYCAPVAATNTVSIAMECFYARLVRASLGVDVLSIRLALLQTPVVSFVALSNAFWPKHFTAILDHVIPGLQRLKPSFA